MPVATSGPNLHGIKVLVVDDDSSTLEVLSKFLAYLGADVVGVESVIAAFAAIGKNKPHVIVTDFAMPEEDGFSFIRRLRTMTEDDGGQIPAIVMTGHMTPEIRVGVLTSGFQAYVAKPFDPKEMAIVIGHWVGRKH